MDKLITIGLVMGTLQATTSGTSIDFTGIPSGVRRINLMLNVVSTNGTDSFFVQIGDAGGIENSGYNNTILSSNSADATAAAGGTTAPRAVARRFSSYWT